MGAVMPAGNEEDASGTDESEWSAWPALATLPELTPDPATRLVLVAPHPDDEVLALGGLLHRHARCDLLAVTDGEASHPDSPAVTPDDLRRLRYLERVEALCLLGRGDLRVHRLDHPDGAVREDLLTRQIATRLEPGDVCLATWRHDGHPDHEAVGRAAQAAAAQRGARLWEYPVWTWRWARPGEPRVPWHRAVRVPLTPAALEAKRRAVDAFATQMRPVAPEDPRVIVPPEMVRHFTRDYEIVFLDEGAP